MARKDGAKGWLQSAVRYYKTHIWIEIFTSVTLVSIALLAVFYFYLRNQYYDRLITEMEQADTVMISATANSLNNIFASQLRLGSEIAVNAELFDVVDTVIKNGEMTVVDERWLRNTLSAFTHYSEDIAAVSVAGSDGLICEYGRYWDANGTPRLWSGENLDILRDMYAEVRASLDRRQTGYYHLSTQPAWREASPAMNVYHIAFPLIGGQSRLDRVKAVVVVTYRLESIARTSAMDVNVTDDNSSRYLMDSEGRILYHQQAARIGMDEADYLADTGAMALRQPLNYFGWQAVVALDRARVSRHVEAMFMRSSLVYGSVILLAFVGWALALRRQLKPVETVKDAMEAAKRGEPRHIEIRGEHEIWSLATEYNDMLDALDEQREFVQQEYMEKLHMDELRSQAERKALESQINAHFIFNTLNAIHYNIIEAGNDESARMIKQLSNILQYTLSQDAEVTLGRELDIAVQYLNLQKYRLMDKFEYDVAFPAEYSEWPCCKLFLQPFIENTIMHGFAGMETGGRIWITGGEAMGRFRVEISDNGRGMPPEVRDRIRACFDQDNVLEAGEKGIGIRNVITRMKMFFGPSFEVSLESAPGKGTQFTFWLPLKLPSGMADDWEEDLE